MNSEIEEIIKAIKRFRDEREWAQFHNAKDLAINLSVESAELLELFLWKNEKDVDVDKIKNELADVFYSALLIADLYKLDIKEIVLNKLKANEIKYPIEKAKSSNKKYNEL
jgi:NTP pyrophosphatase (non-canonical NTP hydrolase)